MKNFQYVSFRKVFVILILLIVSYVFSLIFALQMGKFGNKTAILLLMNRGLDLPDSEIVPYDLMRASLKNSSSAADVNLINVHLNPSINQSSITKSSDSHDISLNLVPPSKNWTFSQHCRKGIGQTCTSI